MANKENASDLIGGINIKTQDRQVANLLLDMSTTAQIKDSMQVGQSILKQIGGFAPLHKPKVEQASFAVLKAPDIPSILVETAFISNPQEEARLNDEGYQDRIAEAILRGIKEYFSKNPPVARRVNS
jgi:N-acetylmuramoyl-L-alanine amidase